MQVLPGSLAHASGWVYAGTPPASIAFGSGIQPVCMFLTFNSNVVLSWMGCVGQKGEKFCTKQRNWSGEQDTCEIQSHSRKVNFAANHLYFWDYTKNQGCVQPLLSMTYTLGVYLYEMHGEDMTRFEFNELVGLIIGGQVTTPEELLTCDVPVSFTPRKKPQFSTEWSLME
jgi:hypothetical protein